VKQPLNDFWIRVCGGLRVAGGFIEAFVGGGAALAGAAGEAPPFDTSTILLVGGAVVFCHGTDVMGAGFYELLYGVQRRTFTAQALGDDADFAFSVLGTPAVGGARILAIESAESLALARQVQMSSHDQITKTLYHYTNEKGLTGILESKNLWASTKAINPKDVRYGNGQYLSDIIPGTKTPNQLSREFLGHPFQGQKYTHYVEIDVTGLDVVPGRPGVLVILNDSSLDILDRIISNGIVPK